MAKSRKAPLHKTTTPRLELNGAVLSKRRRQIIEEELNIKFEKVLHLIDSETVLKMLHKTSTRFLLYEGTRIGEIQKASDGDLSNWAWIPGEENIADCVTRSLNPSQMDEKSEWWNGPPMLYKDFEEWEIKYGAKTEDKLPGEKTCMTASCKEKEIPIQRKFLNFYIKKHFRILS